MFDHPEGVFFLLGELVALDFLEVEFLLRLEQLLVDVLVGFHEEVMLHELVSLAAN